MTRSQDVEEYRLEQIASIASSEPIGSLLYIAHVGLLLFGGFVSLLLFDTWRLSGLVLVYSLAFTCEKFVASKADKKADATSYATVLSLLFARAIIYNILVFAVWSIDGDLFKLASLALLVAAIINILVFHATYPAVIACVVAPIWLCFAAFAARFFVKTGVSDVSVTAIIILFCISPYLCLALRSASDRHRELAWIRQVLSRTQKQEVIGKLVSGVAHDFNNILAVTLGNAELIKDSSSKQDKEQFAEEIVKAAGRGASLSSQLLSFAGQAKLLPASHYVDEVLADLESMISRVFPENIEVSVLTSKSQLAVFVDREQLEVALLNLAINARDAMPNGGQLSIDATVASVSRNDSARIHDDLAAGSYVVVRVSDTGTGVSSELQDEVFDPFFTTKAVGDGTGLGLSMVLGFAKQSGGTVVFDSEVGQGTCVQLFLPVVSEKAPSNSKKSRKESQLQLAHVLLVEDDLPVRQMLENQLTTYGHKVSIASSGQEAAAMLEGGLRPKIIVTDNVMPGPVQGTDLAKFAADLTTSIPTIIVSGNSEEIHSTLADELSDTTVLQKPVERFFLLAAIDSILASKSGVT